MKITDCLVDKYRYMYPSVTAISDTIKITDLVLVKLENFEEQQNNAGYWVKFKPVAGDYTSVFSNIVVLDSGFYGHLGYAATSRLVEFPLTEVEQELNTKEPK